MKKAILMATFFLFPRLLVAQDFDIESLLGDAWYGLYLNGEKAGYALNATQQDEQGNIILIEDAQFLINMAGRPQNMHIFSKRRYSPDGGLLSIESQIVDPASTTHFSAEVTGEEMLLKSQIGGLSSEKTLPKPSESLRDAIKHAQWVQGAPQVGDALEFAVFEPMYQKEVGGVSHIIGIEERVFDGVPTKVYKIKTRLDMMGIESISYVDQEGSTLEDVVAGIITMRLESEEMAKDVNYSNDVIVSNAALVETPIENPRTRTSLQLELRGPLAQEHLFNDERQFIEQRGDSFRFIAKQIDLAAFEAAAIPILDTTVTQWLEPTPFVQSDDERLIAKAKAIVGNETNTMEINRKLCTWVNEHMHSTFSARLSNALEILDNLEGDCTEHSILFIGLARAAGLPAREVAGLIYVRQGETSGFYFHQWAKVWIGKWIDVDPTFNQPLADVTHIKLAQGDLFEQAKLIPVIGQLKINVIEEAAAEPETPASEETPAQAPPEAAPQAAPEAEASPPAAANTGETPPAEAAAPAAEEKAPEAAPAEESPVAEAAAEAPAPTDPAGTVEENTSASEPVASEETPPTAQAAPTAAEDSTAPESPMAEAPPAEEASPADQ